jgi:hypothetical protein
MRFETGMAMQTGLFRSLQRAISIERCFQCFHGSAHPALASEREEGFPLAPSALTVPNQ